MASTVVLNNVQRVRQKKDFSLKPDMNADVRSSEGPVPVHIIKLTNLNTHITDLALSHSNVKMT